jgi:hypothetical protein
MAQFQRPAPYHKLPIAAKQALAQERLAEPPLPCPSGCGVTVTPGDLLSHIDERCAGPRDPGPAAKWIPWSAALRMGVPPKTLSNWANTGRVRFRGGRTDREYLHRDLAYRMAQRKLARRR